MEGRTDGESRDTGLGRGSGQLSRLAPLSPHESPLTLLRVPLLRRQNHCLSRLEGHITSYVPICFGSLRLARKCPNKERL